MSSKVSTTFNLGSLFNSQSLTYPANVTLYQVDDDIYEPEEVATTNLFNTFLDALDGVRDVAVFLWKPNH